MNTNPAATPRTRALSEVPALAERAAELLRTPQALLPLGPAEAAHVVWQMRLVAFAAGATVLREGDGERPGYLLLLLDGEVQVESRGGRAGVDALPISVLGPGSIIGEMALLDGTPRSATCTALSPVQAAALTRQGLEALIDAQPRAAAKLMMGLAQRIAERLRAIGEQLQMYADLAAGTAPRP